MRPTNPYFAKSLDITKDFIQTITIVDDKASFKEEASETSSFNAGEVIKQFANDGKICSVYKFSSEKDVDNIVKIAQKSDITILDWKMSPNDLYTSIDNEADDEEEDIVISKGHYALEILSKVIASEQNKLKLYVIYTDEIEFNRIIDEIKSKLQNDGHTIVPDTTYSFCCNCNKVTVFGKAEIKTKTDHNRELFERSYAYDELGEALYSEFTNFTQGIVAGIFLKSISTIRKNTFPLLNTFRQDIDPAFVSHTGMLPNPDDAQDHIVEIIGSEIKSLIRSTLDNKVTKELIECYVDSLPNENIPFAIPMDPPINSFPKNFTKEELKKLLQVGIVKYCNFEQKGAKLQIELSKKGVQALPISIIRAQGLSQTNAQERAKKSNIEFAKLTTICKRYFKSNLSILTLGVILKSHTDSGKDEYWICIQPKCDSIRISQKENDEQEGRFFTFLQLTKRDKGEIIINKDISLKIEYNITKSRQFKFKSTDQDKVVHVSEQDDKMIFMDSSGKSFELIGELKNDFAQGIANNFASQISRVATNHSEWLRLNAIR